VILFGCPILKTIIVEKVLTPYSEGEGRDEGNVFELRHNTQIDMFGSEALASPDPTRLKPHFQSQQH